MIKLTFKFNGSMVNKPIVKEIQIPDDEVAFEKLNEKTGKTEKLRVIDLYRAHAGHMQKINESTEIEEQIDYTYFTTWLESVYKPWFTNSNLLEFNVLYVKD